MELANFWVIVSAALTVPGSVEGARSSVEPTLAQERRPVEDLACASYKVWYPIVNLVPAPPSGWSSWPTSTPTQEACAANVCREQISTTPNTRGKPTA